MMEFLRNTRDRELVASILGCLDATFRPLANPTADLSIRERFQRLYAAWGVPWGVEGDAETKARHRRDILRAAEYGILNVRFSGQFAFVRLPVPVEDAIRRFICGEGLAGAFGILSDLRACFGEWVSDDELDTGRWTARSTALVPALLSRGLIEWRRHSGGFEYRATEASLSFVEPELSDEPTGWDQLEMAGLTVEDVNRAQAWYLFGIAMKDRDLKQVTTPIVELPANF